MNRSRSDSPYRAARAACTSIFIRAMSTPVGHSRLHAAAGTRIGRPVEVRRHLLGAVARRVSEQPAIVEFRRMHDLAGIEEAARIEAILDLLERAHELRAEHFGVKFGSHDAVAVLP